MNCHKILKIKKYEKKVNKNMSTFYDYYESDFEYYMLKFTQKQRKYIKYKS